MSVNQSGHNVKSETIIIFKILQLAECATGIILERYRGGNALGGLKAEMGRFEHT